MMNWIASKLSAFRRNEAGVTAIEYGVIIALISGVLLISLPSIGTSISDPMDQLVAALDNGGASSGDDGEDDGGSDHGDDGGDDEGDDHGDDHGDDDEGDDDHGDDD